MQTPKALRKVAVNLILDLEIKLLKVGVIGDDCT